MFCKNCGSELPKDASFCANCGQKVSEEPVKKSIIPSGGNKNQPYLILGIAVAFLLVFILFGVLILGKIGKTDSGKKDEVKTEETSASQDKDTKELSEAAKESKEEEPAATKKQEDASNPLKDYLANRFPNITERYQTPASDQSIWIPIDDATREKLDALDNDYNKVAWVVEYAFRSCPSLVVSFTINENCGVPYVVVAFTNIGDKALSIDGTVDVYDLEDVRLTSGYPYTGLLQVGGTYVCPIACPGIDENNVDIGYTELNIDVPAGKSGTYTSSAKLGASTSSNITTSISLENTSGSKENMGQVTVLLLDEMGFPVANGYVFAAMSTNAGETMDSDVTIGILESDIEKVNEIAIFASPYITG